MWLWEIINATELSDNVAIRPWIWRPWEFVLVACMGAILRDPCHDVLLRDTLNTHSLTRNTPRLDGSSSRYFDGGEQVRDVFDKVSVGVGVASLPVFR